MKRQQSLGLIFTFCLALSSSPALATGDCSDYTDLTGLELPIRTNGTTIGAAEDYGPFAEQPVCWQGTWDQYCANSGDVTFKWTAPSDGTFTITLRGSSDYADLLVYNFTCPTEPLYPEDFLCGSHLGSLDGATVRELELAAGQEILIVVDGWLMWNGEFTLTIYDNRTLSDSIAMAMDIYHYPAVSAACAWSGPGRWQDNAGLADIAGDVPLDDDHLFLVYSVSKTVTATALMQLWEDGLFDLDDDVSDHLDFDVRHPAYPEIPITFRMLMSHVSGIIDNWPALNSTIVWGGDPTVSPCEFMEGYVTPGGTYFDADLNFTPEAPGTVWEYSNAGVTLMGCLVAQINRGGLSFEDYCQANIFDPLRMPASTFMLAHLDTEDLATHYDWNGAVFVPQPHGNAAYYPAAGLRSNAVELSRFMLAWLQDGELYTQRILEAATIDTMLTVHYPGIPTEDNLGGPFGQGLVWRHQHIGDRWVWGHHGGAYPARSGLWIGREEGIGVVAATNCGGSDGWSGIQDIIDMELRQAADWAVTGTAVSEESPVIPAVVRLGPCYPNPFNPLTTVSFTLDKAMRAKIEVYDLTGRRVSVLAETDYAAGTHTLIWNGRDDRARAMPSGTYIVRLETEERVESRKVMLVR